MLVELAREALSAAGLPAEWRVAAPPLADIGARPELGSLGPAQWQAWQAGDWTAVSAAGEPVGAAALRGREVERLGGPAVAAAPTGFARRLISDVPLRFRRELTDCEAIDE